MEYFYTKEFQCPSPGCKQNFGISSNSNDILDEVSGCPFCGEMLDAEFNPAYFNDEEDDD